MKTVPPLPTVLLNGDQSVQHQKITRIPPYSWRWLWIEMWACRLCYFYTFIQAYIVDLNGVIEQMSSDTIDFHTASVQYHSHSRLLSKILIRFSTYGGNIEAMEFTTDASTIFIGVSIGQILIFKISNDESESFRWAK